VGVESSLPLREGARRWVDPKVRAYSQRALIVLAIYKNAIHRKI